MSTEVVVISVGTDHHPFDRLVGWSAAWALAHPECKVIIQRGTSAKPADVESHELIPHDELRELFRGATAVVSHGGPSTLMDARMLGRFPIVVPRNPKLGEHVDDHQMRFARHLDRHGLATLAADEADLHQLLDRAVENPEIYRLELGPEKLSSGVLRFATLVDHLLQVRSVDSSRIVELDSTGGVIR